MIYLTISGQRLRIDAPTIADETLDFLEASATFTADWAGMVKWVHFKQGETVYDVMLDADDCIGKRAHLNLSEGLWDVYLHGNRIIDDEVVERATTTAATLTVVKSGVLEGEPLPEIPASDAEQILAVATSAEEKAQSVVDRADAGDFDGEDGEDGFSPTLDEEEVTGGHKVIMTDARGVHNFIVRDGGSTSTVEWSNVLNKPEEYPPEDHTHSTEDVNGLDTILDAVESDIEALDVAVEGKASASDLTAHTSSTSNPHQVTAEQVGAAASEHTHEIADVDELDDALTAIDGEISELETAMAGKASASDLTTHTSATNNPHGVTAAQVGAYTTSEADTLLAGKASSTHSHATSDVTGLDTALAGKADASTTVNGQALSANVSLDAGDIKIDDTDPESPTIAAEISSIKETKLRKTTSASDAGKAYIADSTGEFKPTALPKEIKYFERGVDTYNDILAAINDGYRVCVVAGRYVYAHIGSTSSQIRFAYVFDSTIYYCFVNSSSEWSDGNIEAERKSRKVTSLSSSSTDVQFPSAKCVYDYAERKLADGWTLKGTITSSSGATVDMTGCSEMLLVGNAEVTGNVSINSNVMQIFYNAFTTSIKYRYARWVDCPVGIECIACTSASSTTANSLNGNTGAYTIISNTKISDITKLTFGSTASNITSCNIEIYAR